MPEADALPLALQVARALEAAHRCGILHRDLKPANILATFALAHSVFAFHFAQLANYGLLPAHEAMPLVRAQAARALDIDPSLPDGHAMLGLVAALYDYDWEEARCRFEKAMAVDPVPRQVRRSFALCYLLPMERFDEAAAECRRSLLDDPLDLTARIRFAQCLHAAGRKQDAYAELFRVLAVDETLWFTHFILGLYQLREGQLAEAVRHAERAHALAPWSPSANGLLAAAWRVNGDARYEPILEALRSRPVYGTPMALAVFHLVGSETEAAADWTEKVIAERHPAVFFFLCAHADVLRHSPRWPTLAKLLNLPAARPGDGDTIDHR